MQIPAFFIQIQLRLVAHKQLMTTVAHIDGTGVAFVAIAQVDAVPSATNQHRH